MTADADVVPQYQWRYDWAVRFPATPGARSARIFPCVTIGSEMIEQLTAEMLGIYSVLALWVERGQESTLDRLARERYSGDLERATGMIADLRAAGVLVTPEEDDERIRQLREERAVEDLRYAALEAVPPSYEDQRWCGAWPLPPAAEYPPNEVSVVYFLYDSDGTLAYIGSTKEFLVRMKAHCRDKTWTRWSARKCRDRRDAYRLEAVEILTYRPYRNAAPSPPWQGRGADFVQTALKARAKRAAVVR